MLTKLSDDLSEEVQSVDLVLRVGIHAADNADDLLQDAGLRQKLKECFVFAEFS